MDNNHEESNRLPDRLLRFLEDHSMYFEIGYSINQEYPYVLSVLWLNQETSTFAAVNMSTLAEKVETKIKDSLQGDSDGL